MSDPTEAIALTLPPDLAFETWAKFGLELARRSSTLMWLIGDWWAYGQHRYGERLALVEGADWQGPAYQTCMNVASVCGRFETSRRREALSFSHHAEVASLPAESADGLLDAAAREGWSVRRLRQEKARLTGATAEIAELTAG